VFVKIGSPEQWPKTTQLDKLVRSIAMCEWFPREWTIALKQNNPWNMRNNSREACTHWRNGFCIYDTPEDWFNDMKYLLTNYYSDMTLERMINKYSPASDWNNVPVHLNCISRKSWIKYSEVPINTVSI